MSPDMLRVTALAGEPVDELVWRAIGTRDGLTEMVLEANPGIAEFGPFLPVGTIIDVPLPAVSTPETPLVQLWS